MRIGMRRRGEGDDDDENDEDDVGNTDAEDVPERRGAERYNHKPVIDLLVLKSQALETSSECLPVIGAGH